MPEKVIRTESAQTWAQTQELDFFSHAEGGVFLGESLLQFTLSDCYLILKLCSVHSSKLG